MDEKDNKTNPDVHLDEDQVTTAASPRPDIWKMPDPVFRKTSGRLPQGYEKELANARADGSAAADEAQAEPPVSATPENPIVEPALKSSSVKLLLVLAGIAAMIGFIAAFLTLIYFFFFR